MNLKAQKFLSENPTKKYVEDKDGNLAFQYRVGAFLFYNPTTYALTNCHSCREVFGSYFNRSTEWIGFTILELQTRLPHAIKFFEAIESKLGLEEHIKFYETNVANLVIFEVPKFWRENPLRQQFFSLFLRTGFAYYTGDLEAAFNGYSLALKIKEEINEFLAGRIHPSIKNLGVDGLVYTMGNLRAQLGMHYHIGDYLKKEAEIFGKPRPKSECDGKCKGDCWYSQDMEELAKKNMRWENFVCMNRSPEEGYQCTLPKGHAGQHVNCAGVINHNRKVW